MPIGTKSKKKNRPTVPIRMLTPNRTTTVIIPGDIKNVSAISGISNTEEPRSYQSGEELKVLTDQLLVNYKYNVFVTTGQLHIGDFLITMLADKLEDLLKKVCTGNQEKRLYDNTSKKFEEIFPATVLASCYSALEGVEVTEEDLKKATVKAEAVAKKWVDENLADGTAENGSKVATLKGEYLHIKWSELTERPLYKNALQLIKDLIEHIPIFKTKFDESIKRIIHSPYFRENFPKLTPSYVEKCPKIRSYLEEYLLTETAMFLCFKQLIQDVAKEQDKDKLVGDNMIIQYPTGLPPFVDLLQKLVLPAEYKSEELQGTDGIHTKTNAIPEEMNGEEALWERLTAFKPIRDLKCAIIHMDFKRIRSELAKGNITHKELVEIFQKLSTEEIQALRQEYKDKEWQALEFTADELAQFKIQDPLNIHVSGKEEVKHEGVLNASNNNSERQKDPKTKISEPIKTIGFEPFPQTTIAFERTHFLPIKPTGDNKKQNNESGISPSNAKITKGSIQSNQGSAFSRVQLPEQNKTSETSPEGEGQRLIPRNNTNAEFPPLPPSSPPIKIPARSPTSLNYGGTMFSSPTKGKNDEQAQEKQLFMLDVEVLQNLTSQLAKTQQGMNGKPLLPMSLSPEQLKLFQFLMLPETLEVLMSPQKAFELLKSIEVPDARSPSPIITKKQNGLNQGYSVSYNGSAPKNSF